MFSENGQIIAPDGSVPTWRFHDRVRAANATWLPDDQREQSARVLEVEWEPAGYFRYRIRFSDGTATNLVEAELVCARHNERGSTESSGRVRRIYCTCGHLVRTEPLDEGR